ncbi:MAG: hypothetical protein HYZ81_23670 [Nitrospinae bacterium]|nr:hypothetical protein [Nitrospinota bacterium]
MRVAVGLSVLGCFIIVGFSAAFSPVQAAASETPAGHISVIVGMRKDVVRTLWGEPAEIRKIRVCLGTAEEWVYRGDPERYGAEVRVLSFDADEVLTEIK